MEEPREVPYLSVIVASRNDDHGGNMLNRMQATLEGLLNQLEHFKLESEFILVDWNLPQNSSPLKKAIRWPQGLNYCTIRIIEVSRSIHQRFKHQQRIPIHITCAINTGIRRARGKFILPCAIDNLFSDTLISFIASRQLNPGYRYRIDRSDVKSEVLEIGDPKTRLAYCKDNVVVVSRQLAYNIPGLPELHTNNCGDFQLMSRSYWDLLRGYRECDIAAAHADSVLSYASYAAGVKEVVLDPPLFLYHIQHTDNFFARIKSQKSLFAKVFPASLVPAFIRSRIQHLNWYQKLSQKRNIDRMYGVRTLSSSEYLNLIQRLVTGRTSFIFNYENWGLGDEVLPETVISRAAWDGKLT